MSGPPVSALAMRWLAQWHDTTGHRPVAVQFTALAKEPRIFLAVGELVVAGWMVSGVKDGAAVFRLTPTGLEAAKRAYGLVASGSAR